MVFNMRKEEWIGILIGMVLLGIVFMKYFPSEAEAKVTPVNIVEPHLREPRYALDRYHDLSALKAEANVIPSISPRGTGLEVKYANSVPVLLYHGVTPTPQIGSVTIQQFKEQMFALKRAGYETISLDELYGFLRGDLEVPDKSFVLTFDDGRKDSYYHTDYVLQALDYEATIFVIAKPSLKENGVYYLNKEELHTMHDSGRWDLQAHAYDGHYRVQIDASGNTGPYFANRAWIPDLNRIETSQEYKQRISADLLNTKLAIQNEFDKPVNFFAIPFNDAGQYEANDVNISLTLSAEIEKYYQLSFYQFKPSRDRDYRGNFSDKVKNFYFVLRLEPTIETTAEQLMQQITASQGLSLPYSEDFSNPYQWVSTWGEIYHDQNGLTLKRPTNTTTALVYLDGSYLWENYDFEISSKDIESTTISLIARFQSTIDYVACTAYQKKVTVDLIQENKRTVLVTKNLNWDAIGRTDANNDIRLGIRVIDDQIDCFVNGKLVASATSPAIHPHGGVGVKLWNPTTDQISFEIHDIQVDPIMVAP